MDAWASAAKLGYLVGCSNLKSYCLADIDDRTYGIKRPGLNLGFMSYAMLALSGNDLKSLLDHAALEPAA